VTERLRGPPRRSHLSPRIDAAQRGGHVTLREPERMASSDRVNNNEQGWGAAVATVLLALVLVAGAWYIHTTTYRSPTDPLSPNAEAR